MSFIKLLAAFHYLLFMFATLRLTISVHASEPGIANEKNKRKFLGESRGMPHGKF